MIGLPISTKTIINITVIYICNYTIIIIVIKHMSDTVGILSSLYCKLAT